MRSLVLCLGLLAVCALACDDGVDNVLHIRDIMKGKGRIDFEDVEILTYDNKKRPACEGGKGVWNFPGYFRVKSGKVTVKKPTKESEGELSLQISLEKNSWIVGTVCENGKSKNQFVPSEICNFPLCKFATDKCKMIEETGTFDLVEETKGMGADGLIDMGPLPVPQVEGEWALTVKLVQGSKKIAGLAAQKDGEWLQVAADSLDMADVVRKTQAPAPAPEGARVRDEF